MTRQSLDQAALRDYYGRAPWGGEVPAVEALVSDLGRSKPPLPR